ncbi:MAG: membrane-binding protein [Cytophagaceae bacterium]
MKSAQKILSIFVFFVFINPAFACSSDTGNTQVVQDDDDKCSAPSSKLTEQEIAGMQVEAQTIIDNILNEVGLKSNFDVKQGKVRNAMAVVHNKKRYILYNPLFIKRIRTACNTDWSAISILAHEIGHHLNGHTITTKGSHPAIELEADEFSGFVLRKMGAPLDEAQAAMRVLSSKKGSKTHPPRHERLAAIEKGWNQADQQIMSIINKHNGKGSDERVLVKGRNPSISINRNYVLNDVTFLNIPEKYYLTKKYNLVRVGENGVEVIGKMMKSDTEVFLSLKNKALFKVSANGQIIGDGNQVVGQIVDHVL